MDNGEYTGAAFAKGLLHSRTRMSFIQAAQLWNKSKRSQLFSKLSIGSKTVCIYGKRGSLPMLCATGFNTSNLQKHCSILLYSDDTVIFTANKNCKVIEERLNSDLNTITNWFSDSNFIMNLKKGNKKTEYVIYGTSQRLAKNHRN